MVPNFKMFRPGTKVQVDDPFGYAGPGVVVEVMRQPHEAYLVRMNVKEHNREKNVWVLAPHVYPS